MPSRTRVACALVAFPAGWAVRELIGPVAGGIAVLALIAVCAWALSPRRAATIVALGIACFVLVHVIAALSTVVVGLALGALTFAGIGSRLWRSSSSARLDTPAS